MGRKEATHLRARMSKRIILRIELSPLARGNFDNVLDTFGLTRVAASSKLLEWFSDQTEEIQTSILGLHPLPDPAELPVKVLKQVALDGKKRN
jgi:hypothetical protein